MLHAVYDIVYSYIHKVALYHWCFLLHVVAAKLTASAIFDEVL